MISAKELTRWASTLGDSDVWVDEGGLTLQSDCESAEDPNDTAYLEIGGDPREDEVY